MIDKVVVIVPASGTGTRFGSDTPKQFIEIGGIPIIKRTLLALHNALKNIAINFEIIVTVPNGFSKMVNDYAIPSVMHVLEGGKTRAESVYNALQYINQNNPKQSDIVLIHDGVRPFVLEKTICDIIDAVRKYGAAVPCTPVTDTIKMVHTHENKIKTTVDRDNLWRAQTPQGFRYEIIAQAYALALSEGILDNVTDDSALMEHANIPVHIVPASPLNIKITTQEDMIIAEGIVIYLEIEREDNRCKM